MSIKIITVGKKHEQWVTPGIERYTQRLRRPWDLEWVLVTHSGYSEQQARRAESSAILSKIGADDWVILLDERGKNLSSPELSKTISERLGNRKIVFIVGGAYGVDEQVTQRANFIWSLSRLVFPHQMVRLILAEQIYRAAEIAAGRPYHNV